MNNVGSVIGTKRKLNFNTFKLWLKLAQLYSQLLLVQYLHVIRENSGKQGSPKNPTEMRATLWPRMEKQYSKGANKMANICKHISFPLLHQYQKSLCTHSSAAPERYSENNFISWWLPLGLHLQWKQEVKMCTAKKHTAESGEERWWLTWSGTWRFAACWASQEMLGARTDWVCPRA